MAYQYSVVAGIKVYDKTEVIWKKGMQQNVSISCPNGAGDEYINYELSTVICGLITDVSRKVEFVGN